MIYKASIRDTNFDEITKRMSITILNVFTTTENKEGCSLIFETRENEYTFEGKVFLRSIL